MMQSITSFTSSFSENFFSQESSWNGKKVESLEGNGVVAGLSGDYLRDLPKLLTVAGLIIGTVGIALGYVCSPLISTITSSISAFTVANAPVILGVAALAAGCIYLASEAKA